MLTIDDCVEQMMAIRGALGAGVIDYPSGSTLAASGHGAERADGAAAASLLHATLQTAAFATVGEPVRVEDVVITAGNGYHLLHPLFSGADGRWVMYVWLDRSAGNLAVTQRHLNSIAAQFVAR